MPKGVEHVYGCGVGGTPAQVREPQMPKGVEHNRAQVEVLRSTMCENLRCRKALSTKGSAKVSVHAEVREPQMPKGVEHHAYNVTLNPQPVGARTSDAERR